MDDVKEKLTELIDDVLGYLPWGEISSHTAYECADHLIANGVTVADGKDTDEPLTNCQQCHHRDACLACIGHGKVLYDDFVFSVDDCPYFGDSVKGVEIDQFTKWIPASEPPKEPGEYIVAKKNWLDGHLESSQGRWNGADWLVDGTECLMVSHWMPLPEPPKGE